MRAILLLAACARAVPAPGPAVSVPVVSEVLPRGTRLVVQLDHELMTGKVRAGDPFSARVVTKIEGFPAGTRVRGTVVESRRGSDDTDPVLRLQVEDLERAGCQVPLPARVASTEMESGERPPGDGYRSGAIVGTVLGGIFWREPGALIGFGAGYVGGAVKEVHNWRDDAWLPEGALIQLQLTAKVDLHQACRLRTSTSPARPM